MATAIRKAIIVGASSGIGEALARKLVSEGCRVGLVARREAELERLCRELTAAYGPDCVFYHAHEVRSYEDAPSIFDMMTRTLEGLDLFVYAAGVTIRMTEHEAHFDKEREMFEVNTLGAVNWLILACKYFEVQRSGCVVGISSVSGDRGRRNNPAYCASKAALTVYLESLRNRVSRYGIRVITIKPGYVDTAMTRGKKGLFWLISAERAAEMVVEAIHGKAQTRYVPRRWAVVGLILVHIPSWIFRRLPI